MENKKRLLAVRNKAKKIKPRFVVKATNFSARVKERWRFPHGRHSAIRQKDRGKPVLVSIGYRSPREVRGLHASGLERVMVHSESHLMTVDPKTQGAVIGSGVGEKKKLALLKIAAEKKIRVLNVKDSNVLSTKIMTAFDARCKMRAEKMKQQVSKVEEKKKRAEEKKKRDEEEKAKQAKESQKVGGSVEDQLQSASELEQKELKDREEAEKTLTKRQ